MKKITVILLSIISITLAQDNNMSFGFRLNVIEANPISGSEPQIFESTFSYFINDNFALTGNFSRKTETIESTLINNQINQTANIKTDYSINMLSFGAKFFLKERLENKGTPFFNASIEKYFASASHYNSPNINVNFNIDPKLFEELNSPLYISLGFGSEYFFNMDFSMITNLEMKFLINKITYNSNFTSSENKVTNSYSKLTVGFNFYF